MLATTLAGFTLGAIAGRHCLVPLLGRHCSVALLGAIAGCHCGVPWLDAIAGAIAACHCERPLREKIDQSVTPFSAALFSALITRKLACAIWGLCSYNFWYFFFTSSKTLMWYSCQNLKIWGHIFLLVAYV